MQTKQYLGNYKQLLKQTVNRRHIEEVKHKMYTENNKKILNRMQQLTNMLKKQNFDMYQYSSPSFLSGIFTQQKQNKKTGYQNDSASPKKKEHIYSQKNELLQQITKLQLKISKREGHEIDEITQNLIKKVEGQQQSYKKHIQKKQEIKNKMDLMGILRQKIEVYQEKVFKLQYGKQAEKQLKKTNNKDIVRNGYTDKMLALIPK